MSTGPAAITHILESSLYVDDLDRAQGFYTSLFGLPPFLRDERMAALGVPGAQVLLLFRRGGSTHPSTTPGGTIPPHDAQGQQHLCFAIPDDALETWRARLADAGIAIESEVDWPSGARSLYFRDPDGHSLEVATPRLWPNYGRDGR